METLKARITKAIEEKVFPGCVVGYIQNGGPQVVMPFGSLAYDERPVYEDVVYDVASVTKSVPTSSLALLLIQQGKISLSDKVKSHIPELQHEYGATIEDLLRYKVRGPQMSRLVFKTFEEIRTHILETGFSGPPGTEQYSNVPAYILGLVLERVAGSSLAAQAHASFFGPLGMDATTYFPASSDCAPTEIESDGHTICGTVHDESTRAFAAARRSVGHAGLFSTAADLLTYLEALMYGRFPAVITGAQMGLGWSVNAPWFMGTCVSNKSFGKTGFTGTSIILDPVNKSALVLLSNRTYPKRPHDATSIDSAINHLRRDVADIVFDI